MPSLRRAAGAARRVRRPRSHARFPDIPRRVSGYNLDSLLPEKNFHVAQALVGSEGTLVTVLRAELKLVPRVKAHTLVLLGYPDIATAADAVPAVVRTGPIALEALDEKLVGFQREKHLNPHALDLLPEGGAWLVVQMGGETQAEADGEADELLRGDRARPRRRDGRVLRRPDSRTELWEVRESALGATAHVPGEDLPGRDGRTRRSDPDRLGDYLRDLRSLFDEYGYSQASLYGHFGQGCVHCRIPFDLFTAAGISQFRSFLERAADLVASYGGSLSGEHGDGQARGELLAADVRAGDRARVRALQGDLRPRRPDEPRQGRRAVPARREPPYRAPTTTTTSDGTYFQYPSTTEAASPTPCSAASGSASAGAKAAASCALRTW